MIFFIILLPKLFTYKKFTQLPLAPNSPLSGQDSWDFLQSETISPDKFASNTIKCNEIFMMLKWNS